MKWIALPILHKQLMLETEGNKKHLFLTSAKPRIKFKYPNHKALCDLTSACLPNAICFPFPTSISSLPRTCQVHSHLSSFPFLFPLLEMLLTQLTGQSFVLYLVPQVILSKDPCPLYEGFQPLLSFPSSIFFLILFTIGNYIFLQHGTISQT